MKQKLLLHFGWSAATGVGAVKAFLKFVPSILRYKRRCFEDDVLTFRAISDYPAFPVRYKFIYDDFSTIVRTLQNFGKRAAGPSGRTIVAGRYAFGIEVDADVIQRFC